MTEEEGGKDWHDALAELFGEDQLEAPETGALEGGLGTTLTLPKRRSRDETGQRGAEASAAEPATKEPKAVRERRRRGELKSKFDELAALLEPGAPRSDKGTIVAEAARQMRELRREVESLRSAKSRLEAVSDELRRENSRLRDEQSRQNQAQQALLAQMPVFRSPIQAQANFNYGSEQHQVGNNQEQPQSNQVHYVPVKGAHFQPGFEQMTLPSPPDLHTDPEEDARLRPPAA